ncbi:MAG: potassium channel family protein [Acidimicrobiia bacterium]|nr:potassium channel family protein [Acidimicrobiia bacterium]
MTEREENATPVSWGHTRVTPPLRPADSYGVVLGLLVLTFVLSMSTGAGWMRSITSALTLATLVTALLTSRVERRVMVLVIFLGSCAFGFQVAAHFVNVPELRGVGTLINAAMLAVLPLVVLGRVWRHETVTGETILGLLCVYVGLGSVFALLFIGVDGISQTSFFNQVSDPTSGDFYYFSFVTLTTLGFGDLTPAQGFGQSLTVLEALMGQVFLVTVVARGVSLLGGTTSVGGQRTSD